MRCAQRTWTHAEVYGRDGGRCQLCGRELPPYTYWAPNRMDGFTVDHIVPWAVGRRLSDGLEDVRLACFLCNARRPRDGRDVIASGS
jgi:5-methylcytosine-specific restriction endonuclease McrA